MLRREFLKLVGVAPVLGLASYPVLSTPLESPPVTETPPVVCHRRWRISKPTGCRLTGDEAAAALKVFPERLLGNTYQYVVVPGGDSPKPGDYLGYQLYNQLWPAGCYGWLGTVVWCEPTGFGRIFQVQGFGGEFKFSVKIPPSRCYLLRRVFSGQA